MAASRSRRANAGSLMPSLMKDFHEEETYATLYGGFAEEVNDNDFGLEAVSDDGSDTDFDEEEEDLVDDIKEAPEDDDEGKRKRKKPAKKTPGFVKRKTTVNLPVPIPAKRKRFSRLPDEDTLISENDSEEEKRETICIGDDTSSGDKDDSKGATSSRVPGVEGKSKRKKAIVAPSNRSIRDSTAAKRFETEELEMQRVLRRQEIGPRKKTKHRIPTQTERLTKSLATEKTNRADLAKYEKDEEENEKKRTRKMKVIRGPFDMCTISTTRALPTIEEAPNERAQELLKEAESIIGHKPGEKYTRSLLCFKTEELFKQTFPDHIAPRTPEVHPCLITGKAAKYFDPMTRQYYYDSQALHTLRQVIYRHLISSPTYLGDPKVMEFVKWYEAQYKTSLRDGNLNNIEMYDYSLNTVSQPVNGAGSIASTVSSN